MKGAGHGQGEFPITTGDAAGAVMLRRTQPSVHQTAGPLVLHHLAVNRFALEAAHQTDEDSSALAFLYAAGVGHPVEAVAGVPYPDSASSQRVVGGVAVALPPRPAASGLEAAVVDAFPAFAGVRRSVEPAAPIEGLATRTYEAPRADPVVAQAARRLARALSVAISGLAKVVANRRLASAVVVDGVRAGAATAVVVIEAPLGLPRLFRAVRRVGVLALTRNARLPPAVRAALAFVRTPARAKVVGLAARPAGVPRTGSRRLASAGPDALPCGAAPVVPLA